MLPWGNTEAYRRGSNGATAVRLRCEAAEVHAGRRRLEDSLRVNGAPQKLCKH